MDKVGTTARPEWEQAALSTLRARARQRTVNVCFEEKLAYNDVVFD